MSRWRAPLLLMLGLAMLGGGCVPLFSAVYTALRERPLAMAAVDVEPDGSARELALRARAHARIVAELHVQTSSTAMVSAPARPLRRVRYAFPVSYTVRDRTGALLAETRALIDWRESSAEPVAGVRFASVLERNARMHADGGSVDVTAVFPAFETGADGKVRLSVAVGADQRYGATAATLRVRVEHGISSPISRVLFGLFMLVAGVVLAAVGFVACVTGRLVTDPVERELSAHEAAGVRRIAALCHLSGMLGYLVPLGNVLVPAVLWWRYRDRHPYIDQQGREALNFQLSVLVYLLLSFALILALVGLVLLPLLALFHLVMMATACRRTSDGEAWRYPLTLRFVH